MEEFVTYEQSVKLKELGFDEMCNHYYENGKLYEGFVDEDEDPDPDINPDYPTAYGNYNFMKQTFSAPTLAQAQKWLREVQGIIICVGPRFYKNKRPIRGYDYYLFDKDDGYYSHIESEAVYDTYEESLSEGINKALELIK